MLEIPTDGKAWYRSSRFEEIDTAFKIGIPRISEWDAMEKTDRHWAIAWARTRGRMGAYESYVEMKEAEQRIRKNGSAGS